jgi:tyrosine aminotransferase
MDWGVVQISKAAQCTINPIRKVVDRLQVPPNPQKTLISLGLGKGNEILSPESRSICFVGDPTVFGNLDTHEQVSEAVKDVLLTYRSNGYPPASGDDRAKEAIAKRYSRPEAPITTEVDLILDIMGGKLYVLVPVGCDHCVGVFGCAGAYLWSLGQ